MSTSLVNVAPSTPLDAVTSVADAIASVAKYFTPKEVENVSQDYETAAQARLTRYQEIMSQPDSQPRSDLLAIFYCQLCLDLKRPTGELSGVVVTVPVEVLKALTEGGIDDIRAASYLGPILKAVGTK